MKTAHKESEDARALRFLHTQAPPLPPLPEGGYGSLRLWEKPWLPCHTSMAKFCVILSGALCAKSNLEGVHRRGVAAPVAVTGSCGVTTKAERRHAARVRKQRGTKMRGLCVSTVAFTVSRRDPVSPHAAKRSDAHSAQSSTAPLRSALRMTQTFGFAYCRFWEKPWRIRTPTAAGAQSPRLGYASPSPLYTRGAHRNLRFSGEAEATFSREHRDER